MSEISEIEIKSMTKEQNYMRGYEDGKSDVLNKMRTEIEGELEQDNHSFYRAALEDVLKIINRRSEGMLDIVDVKEAVKKGEVRAYVKNGIIYLTYCDTEETVMIGKVGEGEQE